MSVTMQSPPLWAAPPHLDDLDRYPLAILPVREVHVPKTASPDKLEQLEGLGIPLLRLWGWK